MRSKSEILGERAIHGVEAPVYSYGKLVGTRRVYNDRLLMFVLRNRAAAGFAAQTGRALTPTQQKAEAEREKRKLARLKAQWRAEWQAEWEASQPSEEEVLAEIKAKLDRMRERRKEAERLLATPPQPTDSEPDPEDEFAHWPTPDPALLPPRQAIHAAIVPGPRREEADPSVRIAHEWHEHVATGRIGPVTFQPVPWRHPNE